VRSPSSLIRYDITDFFFDDLSDSDLRHDITTRGIAVVPRTHKTTTAKDRYTKASEKLSRTVEKRRIDYTERPHSYDEARTLVFDRPVQIGVDRPKPKGARLSGAQHHYLHTHAPGGLR
jgi:hypothetical protein